MYSLINNTKPFFEAADESLADLAIVTDRMIDSSQRTQQASEGREEVKQLHVLGRS